MEQGPSWSSFLSPWATLTRSETVSDKKNFNPSQCGLQNFLSWEKKWFWWIWAQLMWLLSCVDGARTILVQFPVTLSDSDTLRECFWQENFSPQLMWDLESASARRRRVADLRVIFTDTLSRFFFHTCLCSHAAIPPENTNWRYVALHGMT